MAIKKSPAVFRYKDVYVDIWKHFEILERNESDPSDDENETLQETDIKRKMNQTGEFNDKSDLAIIITIIINRWKTINNMKLKHQK